MQVHAQFIFENECLMLYFYNADRSEHDAIKINIFHEYFIIIG
ncbi:hypothetical protein BAAL111456_22920 [Bacillus albus]